MSRDDRDRRVWLITGCSSGIGREIAQVALEAGARVAVSARDAERVRDLVDAYPGQALALKLDVTRSEQRRGIWGRTARAGVVLVNGSTNSSRVAAILREPQDGIGRGGAY